MKTSHKTVGFRSNLFSAICDLASTEAEVINFMEAHALRRKKEPLNTPDPGSEAEVIVSNLLIEKTRKRPKIVGKNVIFGSKLLDLSASPMTLELYKTFMEHPQHRASKVEIAERVYGIKDPQLKSERYWSATKLNITKMISRSRKQAAACFSQFSEDVSWFSFNSLEDAWELYTIRGDSHPKWQD